MKGVTYWLWVIASIIAGLIAFTLAYQQIVGMNKINSEEKSIEQFNNIKNTIDNLCTEFGGNTREISLSLGETIEGIYVTTNKDEEYDSTDLVGRILAEYYDTGSYLCIKIKDKRVECKELSCQANVPFIGAVPEEFSLSALVNNLMGKGKTFDYQLMLERELESVNVYLSKNKPTPAKICTGVLNVEISGTDTCTVKASLTAMGCSGKSWEIRNGTDVKCNGVADEEYYRNSCQIWTVQSDANEKTYNYDLYIDGERKDSKSIKCKSGACDESTCTAWINQGCGLGTCDSKKMYQTRTCTDTRCRETSRCVEDSQCSPSKCTTIANNGNPSNKLDVVFVGSGYTDAELSKFADDVDRHKDKILSYSPFKEGSSKINIYRVNEFRDLGCQYNCNGIQRLICCDTSKVQILASQCPVDQVIVLVNSNEYGGAGYVCAGIAISYRVIDYQSYGIGNTVHEFGHSFGCLNDHYNEDPNCNTYHCQMCSQQYPFASSPCNCLQTLTSKLNAYS